jgi:hypothetical protein
MYFNFSIGRIQAEKPVSLSSFLSSFLRAKLLPRDKVGLEKSSKTGDPLSLPKILTIFQLDYEQFMSDGIVDNNSQVSNK